MTNKYWYISFTEYDMGSKGLIFKSKEDALAYGKMCHEADSISEEEPWEQWVEDGMFQVDEATIYGE